ncbi:hypothetical protein CR513_59518, partial [Mucuna pruriens]
MPTPIQSRIHPGIRRPTPLWQIQEHAKCNLACGTLTNGNFYANNKDVKLVECTNSDWVGYVKTRKNMLKYAFHLVSWSSKKQPIVALSTNEVKYIATTSCVK